MKYKYLLFDWDNTLWDFSANSLKSLIEVYNDNHLEKYFSSKEEFAQIYYQINDSLWDEYRKKLISKEILMERRFRESLEKKGIFDKELSNKINLDYINKSKNKTQLVEGAKEILEFFRAKGHVIVVVTNGFKNVQNHKVETSGIKHLIDYQIISDNAGANKPAKEFFDYTFREILAKKEECLLIGDDQEADILGAKKIGLSSVFFNRFNKPNLYNADFEIKNLKELMQLISY